MASGFSTQKKGGGKKWSQNFKTWAGTIKVRETIEKSYKQQHQQPHKNNELK